ncbi:MAG: UvrD-helicase domain-containing protein [Nanobdellota archaeon]
MKPEFNSDGSLKVPDKLKRKISPEEKVIRVLNELDYPFGKRLIAEVLKGELTPRIKKLKLNQLLSFGALELYDFPDIYELLDNMVFQGILKVEKSHKTGFLPVVMINNGLFKGDNEGKGVTCQNSFDEVTEDDKNKFMALDSFLNGYNDEQKKSIIEDHNKILCIAGAGSGKTTVLTKRIEFLVKYKSVSSREILAVTFTRKARQEMMSRLSYMLPGHNVSIETFNSLCEKILQKNESLIYDKKYRVMSFKDKVEVFNTALSNQGFSVREAIDKYYSRKKQRTTDQKQLFFGLINDVFSIIENCKNNDQSVPEIRQAINNMGNVSEKNTGLFIYSLIREIEKLKTEYGLRDYTDQLRDGVKLIEQKQDLLRFSNVLIDEFQDVNEIQIKLLKKMSPENIFAVGDPRQSIYGWRGSKVEYIMNFSGLYPDSKIIQLSNNYRSCPCIVDAGNALIKRMNLPPLTGVKDRENKITLIQQENQDAEAMFIAQSILSMDVKRKNIFVLVRTNKQADKISEVFTSHNISFLKRTVEEQKQKLQPAENEVTISTVHAIKGLEAEVVYLAGVNSNNFPCLVSDNPVVDQMKLNLHYDKYNEELRLLYVAMTRAKKRLVISYYNKLSPFITNEVSEIMSFSKNGSLQVNPEEKLRQWRIEKARELGMLPYMLFSDKTMYQLLSMRPRNCDELNLINGIGEAKINRFGDELLDMLSTL